MFGAIWRGMKTAALFSAGAARSAAAWLGAHAPTRETPWVARLSFQTKLWSVRIGFWLRVGWWYLTRPESEGVRCLVFHRGKVLLIRRAYGPDIWTLPGGELLRNEAPADAAMRHAFEETGLSMDQVFHVGEAWDQMFRREEHIAYFFGEAAAGEPVLDPLGVREARWFGPLTLPFPVSDRVLKGLDLYDRFQAGTTVVLAEAMVKDGVRL